MTTTTSRPLAQSASSITLRKAVLYVNGAFLALMGGLSCYTTDLCNKVLAGWVRLTEFILERADEARYLIGKLRFA